MMGFLLKYFHKKDLPYIGITVLLGVINHFLYEWFPCALIALVCPVNESTWEHLKLLFFPYLFVTIIIWLKVRPQLLRFFYYRFLAVGCGMISIIVLFYTYTGVIGRNFLVLDILIFLFSVLLSFMMPARFRKKDIRPPASNIVFSLWIVMALCFFVFTCYPPDIALFYPTF